MNKDLFKQNVVGVVVDGHFSPMHYIQMHYGELANELDFREDYTIELYDLFKDWTLLSEDFKSKKGEIYSWYKTFIKEEVKDGEGRCIIVNVEGNVHINIDKLHKSEITSFQDAYEEDDTTSVSVFFTKNAKEEVLLLSKKIHEYRVEETSEECSPIYLVVQTRSGFDLDEFEIKNPSIDLELNYGGEFVKTNNKIVEELNKNKNQGLVLLHGEPGTGKTTYIKWLVSQIDKKKKVIFVPPYLTESITSPEFIPFLAKNTNSILVIEDAERVVSDRASGGGSSIGVSNILNMTDGILGDVMNIQIICSFNMNRNKIDSALLRKGRLIAEHKFSELDVESSNKLIKHLGYDVTTVKPMTLAQIYNINEEEFLSNENTKIGF